jgi:ECF transporter S component (folate family)
VTKHANIRPATRRLIACALLSALGVVLSIYSLPTFLFGGYAMKIGFGVLPVLIAAVLYGPAYGGAVGALVDLLQALLNPQGPYIPWFTLIGALFGILPGLFFLKGQAATPKRLFLAVFTGQFLCSICLNTALLMWLYGLPYQIVYARLINQAVMIPLHTVLCYSVVRLLKKGNIV